LQILFKFDSNILLNLKSVEFLNMFIQANLK
jgi:hypothetical protein